MISIVSLICQVLQSNLLNCMLVTQTKRRQYCCHIGDSIGGIITWLMSFSLSAKGCKATCWTVGWRQTKREQYCCDIEDSFDRVKSWLVLCYSSVKCLLNCMLMMQTCSQARNDIVRNSVICNPDTHFACASKQLIGLNVFVWNTSTMAILKKKRIRTWILSRLPLCNGFKTACEIVVNW